MRQVYKSVLTILLVSMVVSGWVCGCGGAAATKNGGGANLQPIAVKVTGSIGTIRAGGGPVTLTAVVANDPTNRGVHWDLQIPGVSMCSSACGLLRGATPSSVEYVPPPVVPSSPWNKPTITASAINDNRMNFSETFTIAGGPEIGVRITSDVTEVPMGGRAVRFRAEVDNDILGQGVTWLQEKGIGRPIVESTTSVIYVSPFGTIAPRPTGLPGDQVTLVARSVFDPGKTARITFKLVNQDPLKKNRLNGRYAFRLTGFDAASKPLSMIGSMEADSAGSLRPGTILQGNHNLSPFGGTLGDVRYASDGDSRGFITIPSLPISNDLSWAYTLDSNGSFGQLVGYDSRGVLLSGSLERQTRPTAGFSLKDMTGDFAFELSSNLPTRYGQIGKMSISCQTPACTQFKVDRILVDISVAGAGPRVSQASFPGTITNANRDRGTGTLSIGTGADQKLFLYVIISPQEFLLLEVDDATKSDTLLIGRAWKQNLPFSNATVNGAGVFNLAGLDTSANPKPGPAVAIGRLAITDQTKGSLWVDSNAAGRIFTPTAASNADVTFDPATGRGTISIPNGLGNGFVDSAVFYLADSARGFILDTTSGTDNRALEGNLRPQFGAGSFNVATLAGGLVAGADGSSNAVPALDASITSSDGKLSGIADVLAPSPQGVTYSADQPLSGTITAIDAATGRGTATMPGAVFGQTDPVNSAFYIVGPREFALIGAAQNIPSGVLAFAPSVPEPDTISITINPLTANIPIRATQQFSATVTCRVCGKSVTWSILPATTGGSVSAAGLYTAPAVAGTYRVVATSSAAPRRAPLRPSRSAQS